MTKTTPILTPAEKQVYWSAYSNHFEVIQGFRKNMIETLPHYATADQEGLDELVAVKFEKNFEHDFGMKAVHTYRTGFRKEKARKSKAQKLRELVRQSIEAFEDKNLQLY
jgi:hypothetical protein